MEKMETKKWKEKKRSNEEWIKEVKEKVKEVREKHSKKRIKFWGKDDLMMDEWTAS